MEEVNAGDAAYGAGNDGAAEEAGTLQVPPASLLCGNISMRSLLPLAADKCFCSV